MKDATDNLMDDREKALRLSHFTIERLSDVVLWMDSEGRIHRVNEAIRQFGYEPSDFIGKTVYDVFPVRDRRSFEETWEELREYRVLHVETAMPTKNGGLVPVEATAHLIEFEGKEFTCSLIRDISERRRSEEALRESEEQYRNLVEMANDGIIIVQDDLVKYINPRFTEIFGFGADQNGQIFFKELIHPDELRVTLEYYRHHLEGKDIPAMYESALVHQQGQKIPVEFNVGIVPWQGRPAFIFEIRDITERKRSEEELRQALREVEDLKDRLEKENVYLKDEIKLTHNFENLISQNASFLRMLGKVEQVASTDATVLILGETGTGKELIARAIHNISARHDRPLVKVNCAALPENLIESELFGHEKGAFTGALTRKVGRFELADGGTIFLDEIGDLPPGLQVKLLRVLQDGEFERLGNPHTFKVNVRVIAATNRDLDVALESGGFREDLFYRLNVFPIRVPPLRERKDDIPLLVQHFVERCGARVGKKIHVIPQRVLDQLEAYRWPGNVRELEHVIERAMILSQGEVLELGDSLVRREPALQPAGSQKIEEVEREHIQRVLEETGWRVSGERGAAKVLGMNPQTLFSRMKKLRIRRPGMAE